MKGKLFSMAALVLAMSVGGVAMAQTGGNTFAAPTGLDVTTVTSNVLSSGNVAIIGGSITAIAFLRIFGRMVRRMIGSSASVAGGK